MKLKKIISEIVSFALIFNLVPSSNNIISANMSITAKAEDYEEAEENTDYTEGTYEYLNYKKYSDYIEISGYDRDATDNIENLEIIIPSEIENLPVKVIGESALCYCNMVSVKIPDTVETIESFAFELCSIRRIDIPEGVKSIGDRVFYICDSLSEINIPASVENIGTDITGSCRSLSEINVNENNHVYISENGILYNKDKTALLRYPVRGVPSECVVPDGIKTIDAHAFDNCQFLNKIVLPQGLEIIKDHAFDMCCDMTEIVIPDGVVSIEESAFMNCTSLKELNIPASVENIVCGSGFFWNCVIPATPNSIQAINVAEDNKNYSSENGVLFNKDKTILYKFPEAKEIKSYTIPNTVQKIEERAFYKCENLEEIIIPDSVTTIGDCTFANCINLKNITIPENVELIENLNFISNCINLQNINVSENNANYSSEDGILFNKDKTILYKFPEAKETESYTIPDSVTTIPYGAFSECSNLKNIIISQNVTDISTNAFSGIDELTITGYIGSKAEILAKENNYKFISIGEIDNYYNGFIYEIIETGEKEEIKIIDCNILEDKKITVPSVIDGIPVTTIGKNAFYEHSNLEEITFPESINYFDWNSVCWCENLKSITVLSTECNLFLTPFQFNNENTTLYCYENSTMHQYAESKGEKFVLINSSSTENIIGDINGDNIIDASDASNVLAVYALIASNEDPNITDSQKKSADVNNDGVIDASDASTILAYYAYTASGNENNMTIAEFIESQK